VELLVDVVGVGGDGRGRLFECSGAENSAVAWFFSV